MLAHGPERFRLSVCCALAVLSSAPVPGRAELRFLEPWAKLGEVRSGVPLSHAFAFVNDGPDVVEILEVRPGCGCLTPRLPRRSFAPQERGEIVAAVNTLGQSAGPHTWRLHVRLRRGAAEGEVELALSGRVVTEVTVQPAALTVFAGGAVAHAVLLTDLRPQPLTVTEVQTTSPRLQARLEEPSRDALGNWVRKVHLVIADDCPEGRYDEFLDLYTSDPTYRHLRVPVTVVKRTRQRLTVTPGDVTLGAPAGQPFPSRIVQVRDAQDQTVVVERVTADDPAITCTWAAGPGNRATVRLQVDRERLHGGQLSSAVHIEISSPQRATLTVPVQSTTP